MTMSDRVPSESQSSQEDALGGLLDYCKEQHVFISSSIAAQRFPGRGLGVYTLKPIKKGERLVHVPTKALLTTKNIPKSFLSKNTMEKLTVHCALAAYLAFGPKQELLRYQRWMATWPKQEEFTETLPVLWLDDLRKPERTTIPKQPPKRHGRTRKRRKTLSDADGASGAAAARFSRSLGVDDLWLTVPGAQMFTHDKNHLAEQAAKIRACIADVSKHLPEIRIVDPPSHLFYLRFLYMWSCVNSRCFYYLHPGQTAPQDSNEAMALCPFQDLFNHSDVKGCISIFDKKGFFVKADKDYDAGHELFLRYGKHSNDILWMEYGFTMDENKDDYVRIDQVILNALPASERDRLDKAGYLGNYTLRKDGVCYRSVMASYMGILSAEQWQRTTTGGIDPETSTAYTTARSQAKRCIVDWILSVRKEAEANLQVLVDVKEESRLLALFVNSASLTEQQQQSPESQVELAKRRNSMCIHRWKQIFDLCMSALREMENTFPGSFVTDDREQRTTEALQQTAEQFVSNLSRTV